jgi:hypothetical protein
VISDACATGVLYCGNIDFVSQHSIATKTSPSKSTPVKASPKQV